MKKTILLAMAALLMLSCQKSEELNNAEQSAKIRFTVLGDFGRPTFTRATLAADGKDMTDLWVFDYVGDNLIQTIHQTSDAEDFGEPEITLSYGTHNLYFVASRGTNPAVSTSSHFISWGSVRDTFWQDYEITVSSGVGSSQSVALDRVATKLRILINDEVPEDILSVTVTPSVWYYGLDYITGEAVSWKAEPITIDVPEDYVGTSGQLALNFFGISDVDEWTTDVAITAKNVDEEEIGAAVIAAAPFKRNRSTEYSGNLFNSAGSFVISLNTDWDTPITDTW